MAKEPGGRRRSALARDPGELILEAQKILKDRAPDVSVEGLTGGDAEWIIGEARRGKRGAELDWVASREMWEPLGNGTSSTAVEDGVIVASEDAVIRHAITRNKQGEDVSTTERVWGDEQAFMKAMNFEYSVGIWKKVLRLNRTKIGPIRCDSKGSKFYSANRIELKEWADELREGFFRSQNPTEEAALDEQRDGYSHGRDGVKVFPKESMHEVRRRAKKK